MNATEEQKTYREKYWEELHVGQQIERMRQTIKANMKIQQTLQEKVDMLMQHEHVANQLFAPLVTKRSLAEYQPVRNEEYF